LIRYHVFVSILVIIRVLVRVLFLNFGVGVFFPLMGREPAAAKVATQAAETAAIAKGEQTTEEEKGGEPGVSQPIVQLRIILAIGFDHVNALTAIAIVERTLRLVSEDEVSATDFPEAIGRRGIVQILVRMMA